MRGQGDKKTIMADEILRKESKIESNEYKWTDRAALEMRLDSPLVLYASDDNKTALLQNFSPFVFEDVKVCLVKGDDVMPIYSFKDMGKKVEAFGEYSIAVPDKTFEVLKKTFEDKDSRLELLVEDALHKELKKADVKLKTAYLADKVSVKASVPEWIWNDGRIVQVWAFGAKDKEDRWFSCKKVSSTEISAEIDAEYSGLVFVRGNTARTGWNWNVGTIDNKTVDISLKERGLAFSTADDWRRY